MYSQNNSFDIIYYKYLLFYFFGLFIRNQSSTYRDNFYIFSDDAYEEYPEYLEFTSLV